MNDEKPKTLPIVPHNSAWVHEVCRYHKPTDDQLHQISKLRRSAEDFMRTIIETAPDCADRSFALRCARLALMASNQAVTLGDLV